MVWGGSSKGSSWASSQFLWTFPNRIRTDCSATRGAVTLCSSSWGSYRDERKD